MKAASSMLRSRNMAVHVYSGNHHKHASMTNGSLKWMEKQVPSFEVEGPGGAKTLVKIRSTPLVPVGRMLEYLEGPLAGSKVMSYYIPKDQRTE